MPEESLAKFILLPELKLIDLPGNWLLQGIYPCEKEPTPEYCPSCAHVSTSTYDHRWVTIKDIPIRGHRATLRIRKRRLWCKPCQKPFTEYIQGIQKGHRTTDRYEMALLWACDRFANLSQVREEYRCSSDFLYRALYKELARECREKLNYPWGKTIGIDEHSFRRNPVTKRTDFVSMIVDYDHRRVRELVLGKTTADLVGQLSHIEGRENVRNVVLDLCDPFKNFAREHFPNARIVADKFHVLRLLSPALLRRRKEIAGDRSTLRAKKLLLISAHKLDYASRLAIQRFLEKYPEMRELYSWKERLHAFYRIRGYDRAVLVHQALVDQMAHSNLPEIKTLRRTLLKWRVEILNYFKTGLTNARTEGFNNKAKVVKRRGYGYKSFRNYRLRVLSACA